MAYDPGEFDEDEIAKRVRWMSRSTLFASLSVYEGMMAEKRGPLPFELRYIQLMRARIVRRRWGEAYLRYTERAEDSDEDSAEE